MLRARNNRDRNQRNARIDIDNPLSGKRRDQCIQESRVFADLVASTSPDFARGDLETTRPGTDGEEREGNAELRALFAKAALAARDPRAFLRIPNITTREKRALRRERHASVLDQTTGLKRTVVVLCLSGIIQGWIQSTINGSNLTWWKETGLNNPTTDNYARTIDAVVNSVVYFAASFACFLSDPLQAWLMGRRMVILISAALCFAASIGAACTPSSPPGGHTWHDLLGCRIVLGVGMGLKAAVTPIYGSEISPKRLRGSIVMLWQLCDAMGIMLGFAANLIAYGATSENSTWRWQTVSVILPALSLMTLIWTVPESPRYFLGRGRFGEAFEAMEILRPNPLQAARDLFYANAQLQAEMRTLQGRNREVELENNTAEQVRRSQTSYQDYLRRTTLTSRFLAPFRHNRTRRAEQAALIVMLGQQLCGVNVLCFYSSNFFSFDETTNSNQPVQALRPLLLSLGIGMANWVFTWPAFWWIDRVGRRRLLLITYPGMIVSMLVACLAFACSHGKYSQALVDTAVFVFILFYSLGQGPVAFTYSAEVFPLVFREAGMSIAVSANLFGAGVLTLCVTQAQFIGSSSWAQHNSKSGDSDVAYANTQAIILGAFVLLEIISFFLIFFFVPETSGTTIGRLDDSLTYMSLEELNGIFEVPTFLHSTYQLKVMLPWVFRKGKWLLLRWFMKVDNPADPEILYHWAEYQIEDESSDNGDERANDGWVQQDMRSLPPLNLPTESLVDAFARERRYY